MSLISIPIIPPNGPNGSYLVNVKGVENSYREETQTRMFLEPARISAIVPNGSGCCIYMHSHATPLTSTESAEAVHEIVSSASK